MNEKDIERGKELFVEYCEKMLLGYDPNEFVNGLTEYDRNCWLYIALGAFGPCNNDDDVLVKLASMNRKNYNS